MTELEMTMERTLSEDWERLKNKVDKVLSPILKEKEDTETFLWAIEKVQKPKLKELKDFLNIEEGFR